VADGQGTGAESASAQCRGEVRWAWLASRPTCQVPRMSVEPGRERIVGLRIPQEETRVVDRCKNATDVLTQGFGRIDPNQSQVGTPRSGQLGCA
jgi:hypothetical protein